MTTAAASVRTTWGARANELLEPLAVAALAGIIAGTAVGGFGSRIAMRIAGATSDPALVGIAVTNNGNLLGRVTVEGTLGLIVFAGLLPGLVAGAAFGASRPWLAPLGRWAGLAFGLVLLAAAGPAVLEPFNIDFRKFGAPALNVAMFALLFPLFGVAMSIASAGLERVATSTSWRVATAAALAALLLTAVLAATAFVGELTRSAGVGDLRPFLLLYFLAVPVLMRFVLGRGRPLEDARSLRRLPRLVSYAVLLAPALIGAPSTVQAITFLTR